MEYLTILFILLVIIATYYAITNYELMGGNRRANRQVRKNIRAANRQIRKNIRAYNSPRTVIKPKIVVRPDYNRNMRIANRLDRREDRIMDRMEEQERRRRERENQERLRKELNQYMRNIAREIPISQGSIYNNSMAINNVQTNSVDFNRGKTILNSMLQRLSAYDKQNKASMNNFKHYGSYSGLKGSVRNIPDIGINNTIIPSNLYYRACNKYRNLCQFNVMFGERFTVALVNHSLKNNSSIANELRGYNSGNDKVMIANALSKFNVIPVFISLSTGFFSMFTSSISVEVESPIHNENDSNLRYSFIVVPNNGRMELLDVNSFN